MNQPNALATIDRARYFLRQAAALDAEDENNAFAFGANLEAAIVYARASLDHLRKEQIKRQPKSKKNSCRDWHNQEMQKLKSADRLFDFLTSKRDYIIHERSGQPNRHVTVEIEVPFQIGVSVDLRVTKADGTEIQPGAGLGIANRPAATISTVLFKFVFDDTDWQHKSALEYVGTFSGIGFVVHSGF